MSLTFAGADSRRAFSIPRWWRIHCLSVSSPLSVRGCGSAEIKFAEWTKGGALRHADFVALGASQ